MKLKASLRKLDPGIRLAVVYGPDEGQVREVAERLARSVVEDLSDPFRVGDLSCGLLKADPARLADEAAALSLTGGRRLVRVRDADDSLTPLFERLLSKPPGGSLVLALAGDLGARSSLRKLAEAAPEAAAVACYQDDAGTLGEVISSTLASFGLTATPEALAYLAERLGGDRLLTRREIEKLALFAQGPGKTAVTLDDAVACVGDSAALTLDDLCLAAADGDLATVDRILDRALREGSSPIAVLRAMNRHMQRLHLAAGQVTLGKSVDQAVASLRPPVFFKHAPRFRAQLRFWSPSRLAAAMGRLLDAERDCKTTGFPAEALCARALMGIAGAAARRSTPRDRA
ncbi:MAG: DNA polymerase III subunit delta [Alphaproteobacteria bacterium]|nr:DNA polymerase III subunit delta [Alphaproteobacteria bacterium]